jgi:hypothetical protein
MIFDAQGNLLGETSVRPEVGAAEGALDGCDSSFELRAPGDNTDQTADDITAEDKTVDAGGAEASSLEQAVPATDDELIHAFAARFSAAHDARDFGALWSTLDPVVPTTFGYAACEEHVRATTGGVTEVSILDIGPGRVLDLDGVMIEDARLVVFGWTETSTGQPASVPGLVTVYGGDVNWLTNCGQ